MDLPKITDRVQRVWIPLIFLGHQYLLSLWQRLSSSSQAFVQITIFHAQLLFPILFGGDNHWKAAYWGYGRNHLEYHLPIINCVSTAHLPYQIVDSLCCNVASVNHIHIWLSVLLMQMFHSSQILFLFSSLLHHVFFDHDYKIPVLDFLLLSISK